MNQPIALEGHLPFSPMTASAVVQVRPASDVIPEASPDLKCLEIWNPVCWSMDDFSRFGVLAKELAQLLVLIYLLFFKCNS